METNDSATRKRILDAALIQFSHRGYAGASVQAIVDAAQVTKPTLYYYFANKAALFAALVDFAHDERLRLMQDAAGRGGTLEEKLTEILKALFAFLKGHRDLMRLAFATAFASPGELPEKMNYLKKPQRNFEFIHTMIKKELAAGRLDRRFNSRQLAFGIQGLLNIYAMAYLVLPDFRLNRNTAGSIVTLFMAGAAKK